MPNSSNSMVAAPTQPDKWWREDAAVRWPMLLRPGRGPHNHVLGLAAEQLARAKRGRRCRYYGSTARDSGPAPKPSLAERLLLELAQDRQLAKAFAAALRRAAK